MFSSYVFSGHNLYDIVRLTDKVQLSVKTNLMDAEAIRKALYLYDCSVAFKGIVYVEYWSAFSVLGYQFKSHCTNLVLNPDGGFVRRIEAPERLHGRGDHFQVTIVNPVTEARIITASFPSFHRRDTGDAKHLIFSGD
jgi:hypothetical protein